MPQDAATLYSYILYRFRLPFRLFLDEGVYFVRSAGVNWRLSLRDIPVTGVDYTTPPLQWGDRTQLQLDSHGYAGYTEVTSGYPFDPPVTQQAFVERQQTSQRLDLAQVIAPLNRLITFYRAKTREYWFRPIGSSDIPALSTYLLPAGSTALEWFMTGTNTEMASGHSFLKTEEWYEDLLARLQTDQAPPLFLDLWFEAQDALARDNLRLAASLVPIAVESLLRSLLRQFWSDEDLTRPAEQMLARYFARYRQIASMSTLPMNKRRAAAALERIWRPRDLLLHGHEVALSRPAVEDSVAAFKLLLVLWDSRPGADLLRVEGPFVSFGATDFPSRDANSMVRRSHSRYRGRHVRDASEAAAYALLIDPMNLHARMMTGVCAAASGQLDKALEHFQYVVDADPQFPGAAEDLARVKSLLDPQPPAGAA